MDRGENYGNLRNHVSAWTRFILHGEVVKRDIHLILHAVPLATERRIKQASVLPVRPSGSHAMPCYAQSRPYHGPWKRTYYLPRLTVGRTENENRERASRSRETMPLSTWAQLNILSRRRTVSSLTANVLQCEEM